MAKVLVIELLALIVYPGVGIFLLNKQKQKNRTFLNSFYPTLYLIRQIKIHKQSSIHLSAQYLMNETMVAKSSRISKKGLLIT
jgi:hypothetical protein